MPKNPSIFKTQYSDIGLDVEVEIVPAAAQSEEFDSAFYDELQDINKLLVDKQNEINDISEQIERLTNHADKVDYIVAASCGLLTGLIDAFFIGDSQHAHELGKKPVNDFVEHFAKKHGYSGGNGLEGSIDFLEGKFQSTTDNIWKGDNAIIKKASRVVDKTRIGTASHHLDDYAHHPTIVGLLCSVLTQFTEVGYFQNKEGTLFEIQITDKGLIGKSFWGKIGAGICNWFGHLVSDMAGAKSSAGAGMGIPGPFLSLAKEVAALPGLRDTNLPKTLNHMFTSRNATLSFDLRCEIGQSIPVLINICLVTTFYIIRRVVWAIRTHREGGKISPKDIIPLYNRTYARMLTISSGVFVATDVLDSAIRSAVESAANPAIGFAHFVSRINIVGVGQFAIAVGKDARMGLKRNAKCNKRLELYNEMLVLTEAKVACNEKGMWVQAADTQSSLERMVNMANNVFATAAESWDITISDIESLSKIKTEIEKHNPGLLEMVKDNL